MCQGRSAVRYCTCSTVLCLQYSDSGSTLYLLDQGWKCFTSHLFPCGLQGQVLGNLTLPQTSQLEVYHRQIYLADLGIGQIWVWAKIEREQLHWPRQAMPQNVWNRPQWGQVMEHRPPITSLMQSTSGHSDSRSSPTASGWACCTQNITPCMRCMAQQAKRTHRANSPTRHDDPCKPAPVQNTLTV